MRFRGFKRIPSTSCTHLGVSSYIIAWNFLFTLILQNILFIKYQPNNLQAKMINEILGTVVLCASAFELTLIADHYGMLYFGAMLFIFNCFWEFTWGQECEACPTSFICQWLYGEIRLKICLIFILADGLVSWMAFQYVVLLWQFKFSTTHVAKASDWMLNCETDLRVTMIHAALIEGLGNTISTLSYILIEQHAPEVIQGPCKAYVNTTMIVAAYDYTGGYFNPTLASCMKFGCSGESFLEHIVVYWISPVLGTLLAAWIYGNRYVQRVLSKSFSEEYGVVNVATIKL